MYNIKIKLYDLFCHLQGKSCYRIICFFPDGWTTNDLIYEWKSSNPVQFAGNISLPGGFKLDGSDNENCDVKTATGKALKQFFCTQFSDSTQ